jgi:hypothetical protein
MSGVGRSALALHVAAAKRLLRELEEQAETALHSLGADNGDEFLAAVAGRDHILSQLDVVVGAVTHERGTEDDIETRQLLAEIARAAAAALESHENLVAQTRRERDRIAGALHQCARPDSVANQYALASKSPRLTLSVTG